jgi:hypothetical protein
MPLWPWLTLIGLGAFHGVNPAMGWLFAVALGLHRQRRGVVVLSLAPIALGHAVAVALVALAAVSLDRVLDRRLTSLVLGGLLIGWAIYDWTSRSRHRVRVGMRTGMVGLAVWSFLMATAHGAGLMVVPALLPLGQLAASHSHSAGHAMITGSVAIALAAVAVHTLAMLVVTGIIAVVVYEWVGVGFLRRGWINLDLLWTVALIATGLLLLAMAAH